MRESAHVYNVCAYYDATTKICNDNTVHR